MKRFPLILIHHLFTAAVMLVMALFVAFLAYAYATFSGPLIGDIHTDIPPDLLSQLDAKRLETILARQRTRMSMPDLPADLPDPYDAPPDLPPPAP